MKPEAPRAKHSAHVRALFGHLIIQYFPVGREAGTRCSRSRETSGDARILESLTTSATGELGTTVIGHSLVISPWSLALTPVARGVKMGGD